MEIVAVILARTGHKKPAWILYWIGIGVVCLSLMSAIGNARHYSMAYGVNTSGSLFARIFIVVIIEVVVFILIYTASASAAEAAKKERAIRFARSVTDEVLGAYEPKEHLQFFGVTGDIEDKLNFYLLLSEITEKLGETISNDSIETCKMIVSHYAFLILYYTYNQKDEFEARAALQKAYDNSLNIEYVSRLASFALTKMPA